MRLLEQRAVAFLDLLGFRELVHRMEREDGLVERLVGVLKSTTSEEKRWARLRQSSGVDPEHAFLPPRDLQFTAFSDCIVISTPAKHTLALVLVAHDLASRLLREGFLSRGAITEGLAYHQGRVLMGPAIVDAYENESRVAKYPRVILSDNVGHRVVQEHWKEYGSAVKRDQDGCFFVDLFFRWRVDLESDDPADEKGLTADFFLRVRPHLLTALHVATKLEHLSKIRWMCRQFNEGLRRLQSTWPDPGVAEIPIDTNPDDAR